MANRFRVYGVAIITVLVIIVVINSILTTVKTHDAAVTIKSNTIAVPAYQMTNLGNWHGRLPMARTVVTTTTVDLKANDYAAAYDEEAVGGYIWGTGVIVTRPEASQMVLAHEYGHAATYEYLVSINGGDMTAATKELFDEVLDFNRTSDTRELPAQLREVAAEYQTVPADTYGSTYYTERLTEYLAQSFARYCSGQSVPPAVGEWLAGLENEGR